MAIQGFFTGDVKIRDLNGVLKAVDGIVEVATDAGTVTSVGLTVGSTGTDVNVANSPVTTSGSITLNIPTSSATNRGLLSSADWSTFNSKQGSLTLTTTGNNGSATLISGTLNIPTYTLAGLGGISLTSLSASSPLAYNNTTGEFSIQVANGSQSGYLSSSDWTAFNSKQAALTFSAPLVNTAGTISIPAATSSVNGYLTSTDWSTFNNKQATITLTTTGSSGAATLIGATLNIPNYTGGLSGYVPYTGATTNVDLGEYGISSGYFQADLTPSGALQVGRMQWNSTDGTMDLRLMGNNVTLQIGQEQVARVVNGTGGNLLESNYQAVKIIGAQGQRLQVGLARADSDANSKDTLGLVTENINNNQEGFITVSGLVNEIDTTGSLQGETWADGDTLYLSGTTSGAVTNVKPTAPTHTVIVGFVVYAHANHGKIFVKIDNGYELEELHDVAPTPYVNKGVLYRDTATNLWKSATIGTLLGYTPANAATTLTINGTAYDLSANRTWSVGTVTSIGTSGPLTGGTITGSGTIGITQATTSTDGYLSSTDWNTFYNKQAAGSYITALTGEATASGPGSATVTLSTSAVTGKLLTGLNLTGGGSIAATDSILQAFGKVQNQISGLAGGVTYQGTWNASTNTPTLTSSVGTKGYYYIVDVAGSTNLNGITDWKIGDWAIFNGSTWDKVDNTDAVSSVNGFTGAVSLTTSNIAEGTNLYYLDSRARLALSFTAGSGAYDNTTGVITIPTNTSQLTNGANFITLSSLSASSPLAYNSGTGAFSIQVATGSQNGYLSSTDWTTFNGKQDALTLTTTGSSGSATLVGATLNVPTYTLSGLGGVPTSRQLTINGTAYDLSADRSWSVGTHTGSLTSGYIPKATGSTTLTDGLLYDTGSAVLLGTQTAGSGKFMVYSSTADNHYQAIGTAPSFRFADTITSPTYTGIIGLATASNHFIIGAAAGDMVLANNTSSVGNFLFGTGATERMRINATTGNVSIGNTGNTFKLEVTGTTKISGQLTLGSTITNGTYTYTLPSATGTIALVGGSGVGTVTSIATTGPITGGTITSTGTIGITQSGAASDGYLSSTDWNTFNNKQNALTNPVTGTGTTNYLPKFTGTSTIGNSVVYDDGTNIGIGTASPLVKLHVNGTGTQYFRLSSSTNSTFQQMGATSGGTFLEYKTLYRLVDTDNGTRLTLDASGNLGLGVTPSAWGSPFVVSQYPYGTYFGGTTSGGSVMGNNNYYNGSNYIYQNSDYATQYQQASGQHFWRIAPSGTAGNAISFTQAMTLDASGRLGIGTASPSYKLDVSALGYGIQHSGDANNSLRTYCGSGYQIIETTNSGTTSQFGYRSGFFYIETSGSEKVRLNISGNLSIGNTNDTYKLDVSGTGRFNASDSQLTLSHSGGVYSTVLVTNSIGNFYVQPGGSFNALTIASTGAATFSGNVNFSSGVIRGYDAYGGFTIYAETSGTNNRITINGASHPFNPNKMYFTTGGTDAFILSSAGATFSSSVTATQFYIPSLSSNNGAYYFGYSGNTSSRSWRLVNDHVVYGDFGIQQSTTQTGSTYSSLLYINPSGNVGIGTTSPTRLLELSKSGGVDFGLTSVTSGSVEAIFKGYASGTNIDATTSRGSAINLINLDTTNGNANSVVFHNSNQLATSYISGVNVNHTSRTGDIVFGTANGAAPTERMRITSGGRLLVGTTTNDGGYDAHYFYRQASGSYAFIVRNSDTSDSGHSTMQLNSANTTATTGNLFLVCRQGDVASGTNRLLIYANGNVQNTNNSYGAISDIVLKENIVDATPKLNDLLKVNIKNYNLIGSKEKQIGVIAQELEQIFPSMIDINKEGLKSVKYSVFVPMLIKALQEQQAQINELKSQLNK